MIDEHTRTALKQQQWTIVINDVSPIIRQVSLIKLWKMFANGMAVTLSIRDEEGQFVVYVDVGHAGTGTDSTEYGRFSTVNTAVDELVQEAHRWDRTWET